MPDFSLLKFFAIGTQTGPFGSQLHADEYIENGIPVINPSNIKNGTLVPDQKVTIDPATFERLKVHRIEEGDLIFARRGELGRGAVAVEGNSGWICGTGSIRVRLDRDLLSSEFAGYVLQSAQVRSYFEQQAVGSTMGNLNTSIVLGAPIPIHSLNEQRRIANFLDTETARIDTMVDRRRNMSRLLTLRRERVIEDILGLSEFRADLKPLKYIVQEVTVGIVITPAKWYVESDGIPALRGVNVGSGEVISDDVVQLSREGHAANRKSTLRSGDVVVVRTGQAGAAAVVPPEFNGANCIDLILIRPGSELSSRYLEYVINSDYSRRVISQFSVGSIQAHFNIGAMKQLPIPQIPIGDQERLASELDDRAGEMRVLMAKIDSQLALLAERRQALITAAVTGQFDASTASGRGVDGP